MLQPHLHNLDNNAAFEDLMTGSEYREGRLHAAMKGRTYPQQLHNKPTLCWGFDADHDQDLCRHCKILMGIHAHQTIHNY